MTLNHAQIILLTYGSAHSNSELFNTLLLMWFPPGQELPSAYLVDTSEEALLIPGLYIFSYEFLMVWDSGMI